MTNKFNSLVTNLISLPPLPPLTLPIVSAHCPLCTGAAIAGVGVTRAWGLDDSIMGIFVGGMIISSAFWVDKILEKKRAKGNAILRKTSLVLASTVLTFLTLYLAGLMGFDNANKIFGIDRLIFGSFSGMAISLGAGFLSAHIKNKNEGKVKFNYQTLVFIIASLLLNSVLFYLIF